MIPVIEGWSRELAAVDDSQIVTAVRASHFSLPETKFKISASCLGALHVLNQLLLPDFHRRSLLRSRNQAYAAKTISEVVLLGYVCFVYMWSEQLERGLDDLPVDSEAHVFRKIFRLGSKRTCDDSVAQHIRNSMAHGSFTLSSQDDEIDPAVFPGETLVLRDRDWVGAFDIGEFTLVCLQVRRFYRCAYCANYAT